jgi:predicted DNA-binding transcriptional regulator AlpA
MAELHCETCNKVTRFLTIHFALQMVGVSRSTVYYWMEHAWIHCRELPSGRRVICQESLSRQARELDADMRVPKKILSETVRKCAIP